jgi:branched-chain amino acid transport system ATP-binding protein
MTPALEVREVSKRFRALAVLQDVSFAVAEGEVVGVVGPNGAGKTTLLDVVAGVRAADRGRILLRGQDVTALLPSRRARHGLARTFQVPRPLGELTAFETALLAAVRGARLRGRSAYEAAHKALAVTGTLRHANSPAASLRLLDRKRLELARALAGRPRVLLLDEIAGGLTEPETAELVATVREVHAAGTTVVWVEHVLNALTQVATRLVCLAAGRLVADGAPAAVLDSPEVQSAYFGRTTAMPPPKGPPARGVS